MKDKIFILPCGFIYLIFKVTCQNLYSPQIRFY